MLFDVILFADVPANRKPAGIPDGWPARIDVANESVPVVAPAVRWTQAQIDAQKAANQSAYNTWKASFEAANTAAQAVARDAAAPDFATLRDQGAQAVTDNNTFLAIASPTNAQTLAQVKALTQQNNKIIKALAQVIVQVWT